MAALINQPNQLSVGGKKRRKTRKNKKRKSKKSKKNIKKKASAKKRRVRKNKKTKRKKATSKGVNHKRKRSKAAENMDSVKLPSLKILRGIDDDEIYKLTSDASEAQPDHEKQKELEEIEKETLDIFENNEKLSPSDNEKLSPSDNELARVERMYKELNNRFNPINVERFEKKKKENKMKTSARSSEPNIPIEEIDKANKRNPEENIKLASELEFNPYEELPNKELQRNFEQALKQAGKRRKVKY